MIKNTPPSPLADAVSELEAALKSSETSTPGTGERFFTPTQLERLQANVHERMWAVCQVMTPDPKNQGTGCLIGGNLLLTNYHVLPNKDIAARSHALFFRVVHQVNNKTTVDLVKVDIDPNAELVAQSENPVIHGILSDADEKHLDFTIVELKPDPYLNEVQQKTFDIFKQTTPIKKGDLTCILQHPDVIDSATALKGDLKWTIGLTQAVDQRSIDYDTETAGGSSGGAVIDKDGTLVALHYQTKGKTDQDPRHPYSNSGVLVDQIARCLQRHGKVAIIQQKIETYRKAHPNLEQRLERALKSYYSAFDSIEVLDNEVTLPIDDYVPLALIERNENDFRHSPDIGFIDLQTLFDLNSLRTVPNKRIVIAGAAGSGKSTLCKYLVNRWAAGSLWPQFKALFLVSLRQLNENVYPTGKPYSDFDLVAGQLIIDQGSIDAKSVLDKCYETLFQDPGFREKVLVIIDGFDELPFAAQKNGYLFHAFEHLKSFPNVIVTSRPRGNSHGKNSYRSFVADGLSLELLGHSEEGVDSYIKNYFSHAKKICKQSEDEKLDKSERSLRGFLGRFPAVRSMAQIPLNLAILCRLFQDKNEPFNDGTDFLTVTALYDEVVSHFCKRFLEAKFGTESDILVPMKDEKVEPMLKALSIIAWKARKKNKYELVGDEIKEIIYQSVLNEGHNASLGFFKIDQNKGAFIHGTFQDYFSGMYLANLYLIEPVRRESARKIITKYKFSPNFDCLFWLAAGHLSAHKKALQLFFADLAAEPFDLAMGYELSLFARCFEECKKPCSIASYPHFIEAVIDYLRTNPLPELQVRLLAGNPTILTNDPVLEFFNKNLTTKYVSIIMELAEKKHFFSDSFTSMIVNSNSLNIGVTLEILRAIAKSGQGLLIISEAAEKIAQDENQEAATRCQAIELLGSITEAGHPLKDTVFDFFLQIMQRPQILDNPKKSVIMAIGAVAKSQHSKAQEALAHFFNFLKERSGPSRDSESFIVMDDSYLAYRVAAKVLIQMVVRQHHNAKQMLSALLSGGEGVSSAADCIFDVLENKVSSLNPNIPGKKRRSIPEEFFLIYQILRDQESSVFAKKQIAKLFSVSICHKPLRSNQATEILCEMSADQNEEVKITALAALKLSGKETGAPLPAEGFELLFERGIAALRNPQSQDLRLDISLSEIVHGQVISDKHLHELFTLAEDSTKLKAAAAANDALCEVILHDQQMNAPVLKWAASYLPASRPFELKKTLAMAIGEISRSQCPLSISALQIIIGLMESQDTASLAAASLELVKDVNKTDTLPDEFRRGLIILLKPPVEYPNRGSMSVLLEELLKWVQEPTTSPSVSGAAAQAIANLTNKIVKVPTKILEDFFAILIKTEADSVVFNSIATAIMSALKVAEEIPAGILLPLIQSYNKNPTSPIKFIILWLTKKMQVYSHEEFRELNVLLEHQNFSLLDSLSIADDLVHKGQLRSIPATLFDRFILLYKIPKRVNDRICLILQNIIVHIGGQIDAIPEKFISELIDLSHDEELVDKYKDIMIFTLCSIAKESPTFPRKILLQITEFLKVRDPYSYTAYVMIKSVTHILKKIDTFKLNEDDFLCLREICFCTEFPLFYNNGGLYVHNGEDAICRPDCEIDVKQLCKRLLEGNKLHDKAFLDK